MRKRLDIPIPKTPFKTEAECTANFWKYIKSHWWFWFKIPDDSMWEKPYDAICCFRWMTYHIEFKFWKEKLKTDVYNKLRPWQIFNLRCVAKNIWCPLVIYYNSEYNRYYIVEFKYDTQSIIIDLKKS